MERTIWVLAEQQGGRPTSTALELVSAASTLASSVEAISYGEGVAHCAAEFGAHGARVLHDLGSLDDSLPGPQVAAAIALAMESAALPTAMLFPSTYDGRDIAARLSARTDLPVLANVTGLVDQDGALVSEHAVFGGTQIVQARFTGKGPGLFIVRPKSFVANRVGGPVADLASMALPEEGKTGAARIVATTGDDRAGSSLDEATVVVSGGRGLGSQQNFAWIERLAQLLDGAAGASRAIVDAGWVPYSHQVGQTGKTVKPEVYLACGISGATQHLVGMKGAKHVIAINNDPSAPIFRSADVGFLADVTDLLPRLIAALEARR